MNWKKEIHINTQTLKFKIVVVIFEVRYLTETNNPSPNQIHKSKITGIHNTGVMYKLSLLKDWILW